MQTHSELGRLLDRFDPFDPEMEDHFFEVTEELRQKCPVVHSEAQGGFWTLSRFEDVMNGFGDERSFTTVPTVVIPPNPGAVPIIPLQCEPGIHREFRRLLDPYFRAGAVAKYEPGIRQIATGLIDGFVERGQCEFVSDFARRLPGLVVFGLFLGLPESEIDEGYHWTMAIMHAHGTPEAPMVHRNFLAYISRLLEQRESMARRDDVVDALLHGTVEGRPPTRDEVLRCLIQLIAAGLDTTAHALGNMVVTLTERPELLQRLRDEPGLLPKAIEELLRWDPPAGGLVRTALDDIDIGGRKLRAGDPVLLLVAAANRDPEEFGGADRLDFERDRNRHLSFGYGAHYCLGVHLARLELRVAMEEVLSRLHAIRIADRVRYDSGCSRGPRLLNMAFTPGLPRM
jgi:cytochrome P450